MTILGFTFTTTDSCVWYLLTLYLVLRYGQRPRRWAFDRLVDGFSLLSRRGKKATNDLTH